MDVSITTILEGLACGRPGCACASSVRRGHGLVHCPAHPDATPSFNVREVDGAVVWKCFTGCTSKAATEALRNLGLIGGGERRRPVIPEQTDSKRAANKPGKAGNLTLGTLARTKRLSVTFLESLGVSDARYMGGPAVRIPYRDADGQQTAVRYRISMEGDRFRWERGAKVGLYGLWRPAMRTVLLVEGESDCWACWYHHIPALGIPGKATWRPEWAKLFVGRNVYIWQEPDAEDFTERIQKDVPQALVLPRTKYKDLSDMHKTGMALAPAVSGMAKMAFRNPPPTTRQVADLTVEEADDA